MARKILIFASLYSAIMLLSGCYVESMDDRPPAAPGFGLDESAPRSPGECTIKGLSRGCLDAYIVVNNLTVAGETFHNADVLANQFYRLINVERKNSGETLLEGEEFELNLVNGLDNKSFANGFEYYISGDDLIDGNIRKNYFPVNSVREGTYDIRIEKKIKFAVKYKQVNDTNPSTPPDDTSTPPDDTALDDSAADDSEKELVEKIYCASLYSDSSFDIERGRRSKISFNEFKLFVTNSECDSSAKSSAITIP